jgi:hypothetical protein
VTKITTEIDDFIAKEGKGNIRDALNVALARLETRDSSIHELEKENRRVCSANYEKSERIKKARKIIVKCAEGYAIYDIQPPSDILEWLNEKETE